MTHWRTAFDLVWLSADRTPDHTALVDDRTDRKLTYRALVAEIERIAAGLAKRGIGAGDIVGTVLGNHWEHALVTLACSRLGAVPALLNARLPAKDIAELVRFAEMKGAVVLADPQMVEAVANALPDADALFTVGGAIDPATDFAECRADAKALPPFRVTDPEATAFLFYTSGTTGLPKGVMIPQRAVEHRVVWLATQGGLRHGNHTRALAFMPLSHAIGYFGVFLVTLAFGGTVYLQTAFNPVEANDIVADAGITYCFAVPTLYHAMIHAPNYSAGKMQSLEVVLLGGGTIEPAMLQQMDREWPAQLRHIYGTTEAMCSLYNAEPLGAEAVLYPGFLSRTRVVAIGGGPEDVVGPGEEGELQIDSTANAHFTGYLKRQDATDEKHQGDWYYSGDVVEVLEGNKYVLKGRVDDVIRSGGENVHPEDIEMAAKSHPGIADCSAIGLPDPKWGQIVVLCVVRGEMPVDAEAIDAHCRAEGLPGYKCPKAYFFAGELPRNAANKVLRRILRDQAEAARAAGDSSFAPLGA
jgi:2-furoate---CoA ligase